MVATKSRLKKINCEGSMHNIDTTFNTPENSIFLAQSKNKVIGDSNFFITCKYPLKTTTNSKYQEIREVILNHFQVTAG